MQKRKRPTFEFSKKSTAKRSAFKPTRTRQSAATAAKIGSIELKYIDNSQTNAAISQALNGPGTFLETNTGGLCCPVVGSDATDREGRQIMVRSFEICGSILFPSAEAIGDIALSGQSVKISLIQDKQSDKLAATISDIFTNNTSSIYGNALTLRNPNSLDRFVVLKTQTFDRPLCGVTQNAVNDFSQTSALISFKWYVKLKKAVKVKFNNGTGTGVIADIVDNSFHLHASTGGDNNAVGVTTRMDCTLTYNCRARFYG